MFSRVRLCAAMAVFLLVVFGGSLASAKVIKTTVRGYGPTYKDAVADGLQAAVSQVMGVSIEAKEVAAVTASIKHSVEENGESLQLGLKKSTDKAIALGTQGVVSSYSVLRHRMEDDMHRVDMNVVIDKYETPGPKNDRRKLAVVGFFADGNQEFSTNLTQAVEAGFTQGRKFVVLERSHREVLNSEKEIWAGDSSDVKEKAKLGRELGADYVVFGYVRALEAGMVEEKLVLTGETKTRARGTCVVDYRVLVPATSQIKWTDTIEVKLDEKAGESDVSRRLADAVSDRLVHQVMGNIYPPRVIKCSSDTVTINQGGNTVAAGERFIVYNLGAKLKDPYTGESLGHEEIPVATVEVSTVNAKFSVAKIVERNQGDIIVNAILRPAPADILLPEPETGRETIVNVESGGVKLPFD